MGKPTGFKEYKRVNPPKRPVDQRVQDYNEVEQLLSAEQINEQSARCMDCGVPYCHSFGCPLHNRVPDFNDAVYHHDWRRALDLLHSTNNFPEITGRVCPALCEAACTLSLNMDAVTIKHIELQIVEKGFEQGWIEPEPPLEKTGRRVAVVGSGPAGLTAAQQLARMGHEVTVFEKDSRLGGILRYGIPDFKLEKWVLDRRIEQMEQEGVHFETGCNVGVDISASYLRKSFDAIVLTTGSRVPRDLPVPGRDLEGIYFAMAYLTEQNLRNAGEGSPESCNITATGKKVVVIGGGDPGSDCVGTARRQNAESITQVEILPKPPEDRSERNPWPTWPMIMRTSSSHEEGCQRRWSVLTKSFSGDAGRVTGLNCVEVRWSPPDETGRASFEEVEGSEFTLEADLVLLAMGFVHPEHGKMVEDLELALTERGNLSVGDDFMTSCEGVFAAGDCVQGASLVVHAFNTGRQMADSVDRYLSVASQ